MIGPYLGQLYIDVPFDEADPAYRRLRDFLEKPDGSMVFDDALFCYSPLDQAIKKAHHDAPGFGENQAANFCMILMFHATDEVFTMSSRPC
ncbi:hypothetical protein [Massilia genomosp. 1]|uniref:hypothetical protein n=1 Tax=Massilia genomosp. 1 TaxID=2609280 RepID=UPI001652842D|nr:hypothetical protein [Massilia genomosp. 1]